MTQSISSSKGRWTLMILIVGSALGTFVTLFVLENVWDLSFETVKSVIKELVEIFLPLTGVIGGFYFAEGTLTAEGNPQTAVDAFMFCLIVTGLWVLSPLFLLLFSGKIEDAVATLQLLKPFGSTAAIGAVGFYFKSSS
jgi:hypothetical protein